MNTSPREQEAWPKKVVVCLDCGEAAGDAGFFSRYCLNGGDHGPTQTVEVLPAFASQPLVEALEQYARIPEGGFAGLASGDLARNRLSDFQGPIPI